MRSKFRPGEAGAVNGGGAAGPAAGRRTLTGSLPGNDRGVADVSAMLPTEAGEVGDAPVQREAADPFDFGYAEIAIPELARDGTSGPVARFLTTTRSRRRSAITTSAR